MRLNWSVLLERYLSGLPPLGEWRPRQGAVSAPTQALSAELTKAVRTRCSTLPEALPGESFIKEDEMLWCKGARGLPSERWFRQRIQSLLETVKRLGHTLRSDCTLPFGLY